MLMWADMYWYTVADFCNGIPIILASWTFLGSGSSPRFSRFSLRAAWSNEILNPIMFPCDLVELSYIVLIVCHVSCEQHFAMKGMSASRTALGSVKVSAVLFNCLSGKTSPDLQRGRFRRAFSKTLGLKLLPMANLSVWVWKISES